MKQLLSISELAARWSVHRQHIGRLLDRGDLRFVIIGGRRLIPLATLPRKIPRGKPGRPRKTSPQAA